MKTFPRSQSGPSGLSAARRARLLWCGQFHQKWRRRVAILPDQVSGLGYEVRCLKCGVRDIEIVELQKTAAGD